MCQWNLEDVTCEGVGSINAAVAGSSGHTNKHLVFIKGQKFIEQLTDCKFITLVSKVTESLGFAIRRDLLYQPLMIKIMTYGGETSVREKWQ
jgi:hypothetical protein